MFAAAPLQDRRQCADGVCPYGVKLIQHVDTDRRLRRRAGISQKVLVLNHPPQNMIAVRLAAWRPTLSLPMLQILVALFLLATANSTFWGRYYGLMAERPAALVLGAVLSLGVVLFSIAIISLPYIVRPALAFALILAAVAAYFQDNLGVVIDRDMLENAVNTTTNESRHLMTVGFFFHVALWGVLPAAFVFWVRPKPQVWWGRLLAYPAVIALGFGLFAAATLSDYKTFAALMRERKDLTAAILPATPINGFYRLVTNRFADRDIVAAPIGLDARKGPRISAAGKPTLTVIVVGETSRSANWSLGQYDRQTNPELAKRDVIYVDRVQSCGTSTAVSMPCMFAHYGAENHSATAAKSYENLLDVLAHAGFEVAWFDNNTGDLGIADRVTSKMMTVTDLPEACARGECDDQVFLPVVEQAIAKASGDAVIVLHQIGSHGPAYFMRYPEDARPFTPDCRTGDLGKCSAEEIVNAYDNSVAYTDHVLAQLIDLLAGQDRVITSLFYVSDHGESLGENGVYLHAAPYFMAPDEQTHVPLVMWFSKAYTAAFGLDVGCVKSRIAAAGPDSVTHDSLFHTVLGMTDVQTDLHKDTLDLTGECHA